ncbi:MAG: aquaporin, partial [Pseudomonadota bacterium]
MHNKLFAEFFGTFWLVLGGCGSAMLAAKFGAGEAAGNINIGLVGVSLAFGLTVLTMAYAVGPVSGGHFNPAVSIGLFVGGRFSAGQLAPYIIAQVVGAVAAAVVLAIIVKGNGSEIGNLASNGFG